MFWVTKGPLVLRIRTAARRASAARAGTELFEHRRGDANARGGEGGTDET